MDRSRGVAVGALERDCHGGGHFPGCGPAAEILGAEPRRQCISDRTLEGARGVSFAQVLEHESAREDRREWVRDSLAGERRGGAVHWLEQAYSARV